MANPQQRGNAIQNLVSGAAGAFIELVLAAVIILALFGVTTDMSFIDTNGSFFSEIQTSIQEGMVALGGIVLLIVVLLAFAFLRRRGVM